MVSNMSDVIVLLQVGQSLGREARQVRLASTKVGRQESRDHLEELATLLERGARKLELRAAAFGLNGQSGIARHTQNSSTERRKRLGTVPSSCANAGHEAPIVGGF